MIEMKVSGVILDAQSRHPIVLLRDGEQKRALLIWIGEAEANAILMALESVTPPRPMTHDLLAKTIQALDATVQRVFIADMREQTFYAELHLVQNKASLTLDARPSDAIALALRTDTPIFVDENVLQKHAIPLETPHEEDENAKFREFLENVKPGDFGRFSKD